MTEPEIRAEVVDLLFKAAEHPLTAEEQALADSATVAELQLVYRTAEARKESLKDLLRRYEADPLGTDPLEIAAVTGSPPLDPSAWDGLPDTAASFAYLLVYWPWPPELHEMAALTVRDWTEQDRQRFMRQIGPSFPDGVHWPEPDA
ncbi:MAG TPA: hypothetical protein VMU94_30125 [Streptosporangiaceae bacterium]|nr:hypothetical protein [Streptosporangiaceae bacterium]